MRSIVAGVVGGLCLIVGAPSLASANTLKFTCDPTNGAQNFAVAVDMDGRRAKAHVLGFPDDQVAFSPAKITPDSVSWKDDEPKEQLTNFYALDRTTGVFTQTQTGYGGTATYSFVCKVATRLF